ncbi:MAG: type II toxin-antitoxin system RelB/DinJ family antitoxin, partial [Candidatus Onthovivens sp.]|nr:type II toxin-antitoxin system RelB/DinJ family antitoxin [Candidatus Onthovivens sp.]
MALINIRVDDSLKENVETILEDMGLNMTTAITIYLK